MKLGYIFKLSTANDTSRRVRNLKKLIIIWLSCIAIASADPGIPDTVRIDGDTCFAPGKLAVPVYFYNDEPLSAVELVLIFDETTMSFDSISLAYSRISYLPTEYIIFQDSAGYLDLWAPDWDSFIPPGQGLLARLYFELNPDINNQVIPLDTITWPAPEPVLRTTLFADEVAWPIYPEIDIGRLYAGPFCGDVDNDHGVNILDIVYLIDYKFKDGPPPDQEESADINNDGNVDILDIIYLIDFKFRDGPLPRCN